MLLDGKPTIDPADLYTYYEERGLSTEFLKKCNSQEFRYIDGYGTGAFLMKDDINTELVSFQVDQRAVSLKVIRKESAEHPNQTGTKVLIYHTAEPKYLLKDFFVQRNYNVTIDKSIGQYGASSIVTIAPDNPTKTLDEVINDFLPVGYTLNSTGSGIDSLICYDIPLDKMSVLAAIDYLCSVYGLVWTLGISQIVYIRKLNPTTPGTGEILPGLKDPINDIRHPLTSGEELTDVNVAFPIYDYCRHEPSEYYLKEESQSGQGACVNVKDPLFPAIANALGTIRNQALLNSRATVIANNLRGIARSIDYYVKNKFEADQLGVTFAVLSEVYGDFGSGPRSIGRIIKYPYIPYTQTPPKARYANNWVGTLTDGYYGVVPSFTVTPAFGLDGRIPPGPQSVVNLYKWNYGEEGFLIRVEWDCVNDRWIPLQQEYECPPETPPEQPPPTSPVPPFPPPA